MIQEVPSSIHQSYFKRRTSWQIRRYLRHSFRPNLSSHVWHPRCQPFHCDLHQKWPCPSRIGLGPPRRQFSCRYTLWSHHMKPDYIRHFHRRRALIGHPGTRWWGIAVRWRSRTPRTIPSRESLDYHDQIWQTQSWIICLAMGQSCFWWSQPL